MDASVATIYATRRTWTAAMCELCSARGVTDEGSLSLPTSALIEEALQSQVPVQELGMRHDSSMIVQIAIP